MHARRLPLLVVLPAALLTAAPAAAQTAGSLSMKVDGIYKDAGKRYALTGDRFMVRGRLQPAVEGQRVQVVSRLKSGKVRVRKGTVDAAGRFKVPVRLRTPGGASVKVLHKASTQIGRVETKRTYLTVLAPSGLGHGSDGPLARLFNRKLRALAYPAPKSGSFNMATADAVMAYRKVNDLGRSFSPNADIVRRVLNGYGKYEVRYPKLGKHVEADLSQQTLALVDGDKVVDVYHTSSGAPATPTIRGTYRFYMQTIGTNSKGMVHSSYFIRGYAIHGYRSVPPYNASHGCLRVPIHSAYKIFRWIDIGDRIRVEV